MSLMDIYCLVVAFISWIGCLVFIELGREKDFKYMYEFDEYFVLVILTHVLIIVLSLMIPFIWPVLLFYYVIRTIVRSMLN